MTTKPTEEGAQAAAPPVFSWAVGEKAMREQIDLLQWAHYRRNPGLLGWQAAKCV